MCINTIIRMYLLPFNRSHFSESCFLVHLVSARIAMSGKTPLIIAFAW